MGSVLHAKGRSYSSGKPRVAVRYSQSFHGAPSEVGCICGSLRLSAFLKAISTGKGRPDAIACVEAGDQFAGEAARIRLDELSDNDSSGSRNRHRHHLSATLLDGRAGNRCGRDRSGGGFPNADYEPHPSCSDCPLTTRNGPKERPES